MSFINNYGYKPDPIFKTMSDEFDLTSDVKDLLFGVELEIDNNRDDYEAHETAEDCAEALTAITDDIYIKHDGSLSEGGLEIVTYPCTLEYHKRKFAWDEICREALDRDYRSHEARTCGLHIHVGRFQMGWCDQAREETAGKVVLLVDRFWEEMVKFSRRRRGQINEWASRNFSEDSFPEKKWQAIDRALATRSHGRYQAVNLQNYGTIEFRLFNGSLKPSTIRATIQLVNNIVLFAKNHDLDEICKSQWEDILNVDLTDELRLYCNEYGLSLVPPKPEMTFKFNNEEEFEAFRQKRIAQRARRDAVKERILAMRDTRQRRDIRVGTRVRIDNTSGRGVSLPSYAMGLRGTVTRVYTTSGFGYNIEVKFDDDHWFLHGSGDDLEQRYYNLYYYNVAPVTANTYGYIPVMAPAMA